MGEPAYEYRIRWERGRREGDPATGPVRYSALRQSEKAARAKADRLVELDIDKHDYAEENGHNPYDFPDLLDTPTIERREVGAWEPLE